MDLRGGNAGWGCFAVFEVPCQVQRERKTQVGHGVRSRCQ